MSGPVPDRIQPIRSYLTETAEALRLTAEYCAGEIARAAALVADCFRAGGRLYLCGNGGSAAQCQHLAAEFVHRLSRGRERPALPALALTADTAVLTSLANDLGAAHLFARQVEALGRRGDTLVAISTSGHSEDVVRAAVRARELGLAAIALTGASGGALGELADIAIRVPDEATPRVQELHLAVGHLICWLVEETLSRET
ncbi:MAG TPA: SIS domain-containing protein [Gemmatimonadales bacterium]|nr:SIS domain-containing protein [Gemmatimonadales bacterium]